jgi:hypothetical protein
MSGGERRAWGIEVDVTGSKSQATEDPCLAPAACDLNTKYGGDDHPHGWQA